MLSSITQQRIKMEAKSLAVYMRTMLTFRVQRGLAYGPLTRLGNFVTILITFERIELSTIGIAQFVQKLLRDPKICKLGHVITATPIQGSFYNTYAEGGSVLYVCTVFEADSSIHSKVIRVPKFRNWVTWPRSPPVGVVSWSTRRMGMSSVTVPNLKRIALFVQKLLGGSKNFDIGSRDPKLRPFWTLNVKFL